MRRSYVLIVLRLPFDSDWLHGRAKLSATELWLRRRLIAVLTTHSIPAPDRSATKNGRRSSKTPLLQELIRTALKQNYNVQIAATRIQQANAQLTITRANQLPDRIGRPGGNRLAPAGNPGSFRRLFLCGRCVDGFRFLERRFLGKISPCDGSRPCCPACNRMGKEGGDQHAC